MNCEKYQILIDDLIENELDEQNADEVTFHFSACSECADYYAALREEKAVYAQFLLEVEPPQNLWAQFESRLENETAFLPAPIVETAEKQKSSFFNFFSVFRLCPALGFAAVLLVLGIGLFKAIPDAKTPETAVVIPSASEDGIQIHQEDQPIGLPVAPISSAPVNNLTKPAAAVRKPKLIKPKPLTKLPFGAALAKTEEASRPRLKTTPEKIELSAEQQQWRQIEKENAQQIEKIEILLRSFRNARIVEGGTLYDIAYEKQQARRLLERNVQLRQLAEVSGNLYAEEILSKAETFLLDIANLENNPLPEEVLDIKERVKNQSIIASLQVY